MYLGVYDPFDVATADLYGPGCATHGKPECLCDVDPTIKAPEQQPSMAVAATDEPALAWMVRRLQAAEHPQTDRERLAGLLIELDSDPAKRKVVRMIVEGKSNVAIRKSCGPVTDKTMRKLRDILGVPAPMGMDPVKPEMRDAVAFVAWAKADGQPTAVASAKVLERWPDLTRRDASNVVKSVWQAERKARA